MSLAAGTRLGPYEVVSPLGAGGMGEVYKARDTRLDRTVAIKVLPESLAGDPGFRERFDREARAISQLDHPNICALHDVGEHQGTSYLVMQYLDGETLAARLERGTLDLPQALAIAVQIAGALDSAHRAGIVHRDLKPGNVMLTASGARLLDFGLAKTAAPAIAGSAVSMAATVGSPLTAKGTILGTFQYMAPEQIEGQEAGARTDIFAFGVVLYEMLTGRKAFEGKTQASLIGAILKDEPPPVSAIRPVTPPLLDHIVRTCLAKDPADRWQSARDVKRQLEWLTSNASAVTGAVAAPRRRQRTGAMAVGIAGAVIVAAVAAFVYSRRDAGPTAGPVLTLTLLPPPGTTFTQFYSSATPHFALSPDGRRIAVIVSRPGRQPSLWIRALDSPNALELPGTEDASGPFWSPDGDSVGFIAQGQVKTMRVGSGRPEILTESRDRAAGAAWSTTGDILFGRTGRLRRIAAAGGPVTNATRAAPDGGDAQRWPQFLPDGRHYLFTERAAEGAGQVDGEATRTVTYLAELGSEQTTEICACKAVFAPPRHLLRYAAGRLLAQEVDPRTLMPLGEPRPLVEQVNYAGGAMYPPVTASDNGLIAYWEGTPIASELHWYDRGGNRLPAAALPVVATGSQFALSPDGQTVALARADRPLVDARAGDIWLFDPRGSPSRFSFGGGTSPLWSRDGRRLAYQTNEVLLQRVVAGTEREQSVADIKAVGDFTTDWSPDGRFMVVGTDVGTGWDLIRLNVADGKRTPLLQTPANEVQGRISPDGRWLAYASDESGRFEVYVQPLPLTGVKWQLSTDGGTQPVWKNDGRELFFVAADSRLMAVSVSTSAGFVADTPRALFQTRMRPSFEPFSYQYATNDGTRFLINSAAEGAGPTITVMSNWTGALK
jgi:Tol biopolymer transport system component